MATLNEQTASPHCYMFYNFSFMQNYDKGILWEVCNFLKCINCQTVFKEVNVVFRIKKIILGVFDYHVFKFLCSYTCCLTKPGF